MKFDSRPPKVFFHEALMSALNKMKLKFEALTELYLVELLAQQVSKPICLDPLVDQFARAVTSTSHRERLIRFKGMGDSALVLLGLWSEHIRKRGSTRAYVIEMGGSAYKNAASLSTSEMSKVYSSLYEGFGDLAVVLTELKEVTFVQPQRQPLELYERYLDGYKSSLEQLNYEGLFICPNSGDDN